MSTEGKATAPCYASPLRLTWTRLKLRLCGYRKDPMLVTWQCVTSAEWNLGERVVWVPLDASEQYGEAWWRRG